MGYRSAGYNGRCVRVIGRHERGTSRISARPTRAENTIRSHRASMPQAGLPGVGQFETWDILADEVPIPLGISCVSISAIGNGTPAFEDVQAFDAHSRCVQAVRTRTSGFLLRIQICAWGRRRMTTTEEDMLWE
jgi:hypothetical protein